MINPNKGANNHLLYIYNIVKAQKPRRTQGEDDAGQKPVQKLVGLVFRDLIGSKLVSFSIYTSEKALRFAPQEKPTLESRIGMNVSPPRRPCHTIPFQYVNNRQQQAGKLSRAPILSSGFIYP
jgi:hypothetical protein